jgi:hypothetical protein
MSGKNVIEDIKVISEVCDEDMGGTSGALYSCVPTVRFRQVMSDLADSGKDLLRRFGNISPRSSELWSQVYHARGVEQGRRRGSHRSLQV